MNQGSPLEKKMAPDLVRAGDIIAARGGALGHPLHLLSETTSTNDEAKAGAREGAPHGSVWIAETQSRGRGRQGRVWISPPGENLLFSVLLRIACTPAHVPPLSLVCGLAVRDAVAKALAKGDSKKLALVKWPNDVVVRDADDKDGPLQKIAGILVESVVVGSKVEQIVVGIGVNVHTRVFPEELAGIATSVALEGAEAPDRAELLADILGGLDHDVEHVAHRGLGLVHARLSAHDALLGRRVEVDQGSSNAAADLGVACGIESDGRLLVRRIDGGIAKIASGEIRLRSS